MRKREEQEETAKQLADEKLQRKVEKQKKYEKSRQHKKLKKRENDWGEWESLQKEENLAKKLKRGKITQEEFDKLVDGELTLSD